MVAKIAERLWSSARDWAEDVTGSIDNRLNEHRIRLAVTGLSRSGKTVFITSLIHNLIALGRGRDTLPRVSRRLSQNGRNRLKGVKLLPPGTQTLPYFDFPARLAELAGSAGTQPKWPERTQNLAQISIELHIEHESTLRQKLGDKRVRLDILDYPGEWLLDLPLLDQSFVQWSTDTLQALMLQPQRRHAAQFLDFLQIVSPKDPASDERLRCGHQLYR